MKRSLAILHYVATRRQTVDGEAFSRHYPPLGNGGYVAIRRQTVDGEAFSRHYPPLGSGGYVGSGGYGNGGDVSLRRFGLCFEYAILVQVRNGIFATIKLWF